MIRIAADTALLPTGWAHDVVVVVGSTGKIESVQQTPDTTPVDHRVKALIPALANLHSHTFQRAMAGLSEARSPAGKDSFWTWREVMYRLLDALTPQDIQDIAAFAFMEMLESGYGSVAEFHYLHHQFGGGHYDDIGELSVRIIEAAHESGIGLTLLPVHYTYGGLDQRPLVGGQRRFGNNLEDFIELAERGRILTRDATSDTGFGVAPHSLRAVSAEDLQALAVQFAGQPIHMHIAEQTAEIDQVLAHTQSRPVEWLLDHLPVDDRWCLIHSTHMTRDETRRLAETGGVVGLCPVTEGNLGDGIFNGSSFVAAGGRFGVGTDSNICISSHGELRQLEYSQRLRDRGRAMLAEADHSTGRFIFDTCSRGGAQALNRTSGTLEEGQWADLVALDLDQADLPGVQGDTLLDAWIFAARDQAVDQVWSAGRHVVMDGKHVARDIIAPRYAATLTRLMSQW